MSSNRLTQSVARLIQAGSEYSKAIEKLGLATDNLAGFLGNMFPSPDGHITLPGHYHLQNWPSGEYQLEKYDENGDLRFKLTRDKKRREDLLAFSAEVANGWLDEVSAWIERQATSANNAARIIENHRGMIASR